MARTNFGDLPADKAYEALKFNMLRQRERNGDLMPTIQHGQLLSDAVERHHQAMAGVLAATAPRPHIHSEIRSMNSTMGDYQEVDEFSSDDDEPEETPVSPPPQLLPAISPTAKTTSKKELNPVNLLISMRAQPSGRSLTAMKNPALEALRRRLPEDDDEDEDADAIVKADVAQLRGRSFLARPELQGSATDDMLATIRGPGWQAQSLTASKSVKIMPSFEVPGLRASERSGELPPLADRMARSFSSGKRSGALPAISIGSSQAASGDRLSRLATASETPQSPLGRSAGSPSGGGGQGLFGMLKSMVKKH